MSAVDFPWLREGATPALSDLGNRIADCIKRHGYSEHDWLMRSVKKQIEELGHARLMLTVSQDANGKWTTGPWRPA